MSDPPIIERQLRAGNPLDDVADLKRRLLTVEMLLPTGDEAGSSHDPATLGAGSDPILTLVGQEFTLGDVATQAELDGHEGDAVAHHNWPLLDGDIPETIARDSEVTTAVSNHTADADAHHNWPLGDSDIPSTIARDSEVTTAVSNHTADADAHHAPVTLGSGSDPILSLDNQELTLGNVATQAELDAHAGDEDAHHDPFQGYQSISGFRYWEYDGLGGTEVTVIPDGAGDVAYSLRGEMIVVLSSTGQLETSGIDIAPGYSIDAVFTVNDRVTLYCNANGSVTIRRVEGAETYKVALRLFWL